MPKLTNRRRERFAIEIAAMVPLEQAYVAAGFKDSQWARFNASKLSHHPEVAARIQELQDEFAARSQLSVEYLQAQLLPLLEANPRDLFQPAIDAAGNRVNKLRPISEMPRRLAAAISRFKVDEQGTVREIVMADKISAGGI